jgi:hypothetical protein
MKYQNTDIVDLAATASYISNYKIESLACELNKFNLIARDLNVIKRSTSKQDEYEIYISQNSIKISDSVLDWWLCN